VTPTEPYPIVCGVSTLEIKVTPPRVVLADDRASMARQLRALLTPSCEILQIVADGVALVAAVEALGPDVIVTDIGMPGLSGLAATRIILAQHPSARVVVVTVRDEPAVIREAFQVGVLGYVMKGDAGEELAGAVHAAMVGKPYVSTNARSALQARDREGPRPKEGEP
jgi:two-component system NarL family response regulator